ncbi:MAG TPA: type II secretion system protein GspL [Gammaproteobacteria bacterium]|nr:type II secretion system protein GspL [Gammaproteobacteria bacterium]
MTRRTIIYLHSIELAQASWAVCENEEIEKTTLRGHLSDLPEIDKQNEIIIIVPAWDILLAEVPLPKLNRPRLMQALPFALEDKLIEDVDQLHFAIADYQPDGTVPVAIVARKKMNEWTALFKQYEIFPTALYSSVFILPDIEKNWSASILQEGATVRQNKFTGFSGEQANLPLLMEYALQNSTEKPECIHIYSTFSTPAEIKPDQALVNEIYLSEQSFLETFPDWIKPESSINLLQGNYQPRRKSSETKKIWTLAAYAAVIWIGLAFFAQLVSFIILHHENNKIESEITAIYKKNFPNASSIVDPRARMESKLASLEEETNKNYFLVLLAKTGHELLQQPDIQIKNLEFRDNQLTLELAANTFDDLDKLTRHLTAQGLKVKQQNAATAGNQVKASLIIQRNTT